MPSMPLQIALLGAPRVEAQGRTVAIERRQARALLYRLAAALQPMPREILCALFWPEIGEDVARRNLSRLITILHHALPDLLHTVEDQLGLNWERAEVDVRGVNQLWGVWKTQGEIDALRRAIGLVRGPFLAGFSLPGNSEFDTWAAVEREYWNRLTLEGLEALIDAEVRRQAYRSAIEFARRSLALDELNEGVHRRLIELYARTGDRAAALHQYERCALVLERELGVDPLPETQALYHAVQHRRTSYPLSPVKPPAPSARPAIDWPLVGRENALRVLNEALAAAWRDRCRVVLIAGEPGIGKSRLMHEFTVGAQDGALVLAGVCYPETQNSPFQPLIEALRSQLGAEPLPLVGHPPWLGDVARLLPELVATQPGLVKPPPSEPGWARVRLFEALELLIAQLTGETRPAILCFDDLHWADSVTLDWLAHLVHHSPVRLLVVGAYRNEDGAHLAGLVESLSRHGILTELTLEGLNLSDVGQLLRQVGHDAALDESLANHLQQATGGNPFFLLELLRPLVELGGRPESSPGGDELVVPGSVQLAVRARLLHLSAKARQVMEGAAVLGDNFDLDTVAQTVGRSESETIDALEEADHHNLLLPEAELYRFRHAIVREVIYQDLSHYRRRLLHRRAGEALERWRPTDATALARHFEQADQPGRAAGYALRAGDMAKRAFACVEARAWFDRALALLQQEAPTLQDPKALEANRRARIEALSERGWALRLVGDMAAYARDLEEESRLVELLHDPRALAHVRQRQASAHIWFGRYSAALAAADEALCLIARAGDPMLEALCWRKLGLAARALGDYERAEAALQRALSLFSALEEDRLCVHTLGNLSTLYTYQARTDEAVSVAQQALALCDSKQLLYDRRLPLGDLGAAALAAGDGELARRYLEDSLTLAGQVADRTQEILCQGHLGWLEVQAGRPAQALRRLQLALSLAEQIDSRAEQPWLHAGLAEALYLAGRPDQALSHAQRALLLAEASGQIYDQRLARRALERLHPRPDNSQA